MDADVVVVGGGSGGCAAVHALAHAGLAVVLVEAGPDYGRYDSGRWPSDLLDSRRFPRSHDSGLVIDGGDGPTLRESRAKVIGGCSAHNQCAAQWPPASDWEAWAGLVGDPSWRYDAARPRFDEIEDALSGDPAYRGHGGRLPTRAYGEGELAAWQRGFRDAALGAGLPPLTDFSSPVPYDGVSPFQVNVVGDVRWNAAFAFVDPVRDRVQILERTLADRLVLERDRAVALVALREDGGTIELEAREFVIAAGVYGTPAILQRSGVGRATDLKAVGIPVALDLADVGRNLSDHPGVEFVCTATEDGSAALAEDLAAGRFHQSQVAARLSAGPAHVLPYHARADGGWTFSILVFTLAPAARGSVAIRSADPTASPRIHLPVLRDVRDRDALADGIALARRLTRTAPLSALVAPLSADEPPVEVATYGHAVGTCALGAVTRADGRVHGLANVSVADAALLPAISQNPNLAVLFAGWSTATRVRARLTGQ